MIPDWLREEILRHYYEGYSRHSGWHGSWEQEHTPPPKPEIIEAGLAPVNRRVEIRLTEPEIFGLPREAFEKLRRGVLQADVNATVRTEYEILSRATVIRISYAPPTITTLKGRP